MKTAEKYDAVGAIVGLIFLITIVVLNWDELMQPTEYQPKPFLRHGLKPIAERIWYGTDNK